MNLIKFLKRLLIFVCSFFLDLTMFILVWKLKLNLSMLLLFHILLTNMAKKTIASFHEMMLLFYFFEWIYYIDTGCRYIICATSIYAICPFIIKHMYLLLNAHFLSVGIKTCMLNKVSMWYVATYPCTIVCSWHNYISALVDIFFK